MSLLRVQELGFPPGTALLISLIGIITFVLVTYFKRQKKLRTLDEIPGPVPYSMLEHSKLLSGGRRDVFQFNRGMSYIWSFTNAIYRVRFGPVARIVIIKASAAEVILSSSKHMDKSKNYSFLHPWLGTGLLTSSGEKWHSRRKLLTPAFHFKILEDFVDVFNKQSNVLVNKLKERADGITFDIYPFITLCTLDIICETAMGCSVDAQEKQESDYVSALLRMTKMVMQRMATPWQQYPLVFKLMGYEKQHKECLKILHDFTRETINKRRQAYESLKRNGADDGDDNDDETEFVGKKKKRLAFLDLLLEFTENGKKLSDDDIREEVDTFMFEGHDTTATSINWFLYFMGTNPHIQDKVHEEVDSIFGDSDRPATMADLRELNYTERCIKESLRLYPSVPSIAREITDNVVLDGHRIPAGISVVIQTYRLHRDPDQFPNPEVFDPDRFLPENCKRRHPYAYIPFSAGPRNCIGQKFALMEEKIILSTLMRKFRIESTVRREDLKVVSSLIIRPEEGNFVKLYPRARN